MRFVLDKIFNPAKIQTNSNKICFNELFNLVHI